MKEEESVVFCPVDPYVEDSYFQALMKLGELAAGGAANLTLIGIAPTYPSEKYGYIIPRDGNAVSEVLSFREKPDARTAEAYIRQGALWNGGVFACKLGYLLRKARELTGVSAGGDHPEASGVSESIRKAARSCRFSSS